MNEQFEFTDRYEALGIPYPDPQTMCKGQCEGAGVYPCYFGLMRDPTELTEEEIRLWNEAHNVPEAHSDEPCDGWHFIKCPDCKGTGKITAPGSEV